jgi:hypothetical protein
LVAHAVVSDGVGTAWVHRGCTASRHRRSHEIVVVRRARRSYLVAPALGGASAQPTPPRQEHVAFAAGASAATVKGQLKGDESIDYLVRASAGQTIAVTLTPSNRSTYFNVLPPGSADVAMFADQSGEPYKGMLPADGDYKVRVYQMRNAARTR